MKYMILCFETAEDFARRADPDLAPGYWAAWGAYAKALGEGGVMVSGAGLEATHASTTVRLRDGRRVVQDGPYADAKEQLGGFFIIDVADLDAALGWAARSPSAASGSVEVRPLLPPMG